MNFTKYFATIITAGILKFLIAALVITLLIKFSPSIITSIQNALVNNTKQTTNTNEKKSQHIGEIILQPMTESLKRQQEERRANAPKMIIGYQEKNVAGKSWKECIEEYGRGRNELNEKVVRCQSGYTEKIPIYNK